MIWTVHLKNTNCGTSHFSTGFEFLGDKYFASEYKDEALKKRCPFVYHDKRTEGKWVKTSHEDFSKI